MLHNRLLKIAMQDPYQFPKNWKVPAGTGARIQKKQQELDLWRQWKETNEDPKYLEPLMRSLKPTIDYRVNTFAAANVYKPALRAKANNLTIEALRKFDPTKAELNTHVTNNLKGLNRWTGDRQNVARITEERRALLGRYKASKEKLKELYGYEPTARQISEDLKVPEKTIKKLELEDRPDLVASMFEDGSQPNDINMPTIEKEIMELIEFSLTMDELRLWEYLYGLKGKTKTTKGGDLAKKLGWSQSKVSQVRKDIYSKIDYYRQGLS